MKNFLIIALAIVCIYLLFFRRTVEPETSRGVAPEAKELVDAEVKRVNKNIDDKGFEHAVIEEIENVVGNVDLIRDSARKEFDSIAHLLKIERNNIKEWRQVAATWRDSFLVAKRVSDTSYRYTNRWANIEFVSPKDTSKGRYFNYKYDAEINYVDYWTKRGLFSKKKHYIDFWINDTSATINGVKRIKIQPKESPVLEVNAVGQHYITPSAGGEVMYRNGRMQLGGGYYYDFHHKRWVPAVRLKFNALQF